MYCNGARLNGKFMQDVVDAEIRLYQNKCNRLQQRSL